MEAVIGVDPHKYVLTAVALDARGGVLGRWSGEASSAAFRALRGWAAAQAPGAVWAIEGSNRLGRRLAVLVAADGTDVRDVCPTRTADQRRRRPGRGKSDAVDAEAIARELLAHPDLPRAFKAAAAGPPDPLREELALLVRARRQLRVTCTIREICTLRRRRHPWRPWSRRGRRCPGRRAGSGPQRYSPVSVMWAHPSGDRWARCSSGIGTPWARRPATARSR
jgi:transposase